MSTADVIRAIRRRHLKANIERISPRHVGWHLAWVDPGGTIFGPGPYLKVPIVGGEWKGTTQRVYAPARLRRQLAKNWTRDGNTRP